MTSLNQTADRFSPVVQAIVNKLESHKADLSLQDIWYGDQTNIPRTPAVAVEPAPFRRDLSGIGGKGRTDNTIQVYLIVYLNSMKNVQDTRKDADVLSENIMDVLHEDITMGGTVIHGFVQLIEPGYLYRNNVLMRSARITWQGMSKTLIS